MVSSYKTALRMVLASMGAMSLLIGSIPALAAAVSNPTVSVAGITLRSTHMQLPGSDTMFPGGTEAEAINNNCLACHSAGMVLNQSAMTRASWQAEVDKMKSTYKAPLAVEDVPAIVDYLVKTKGRK